MQIDKGFYGSLFDFSFNSFVTNKIIPILYALSIVVIVLEVLGIVIFCFNVNPGLGAVGLVVIAPIIAAISIIYARVVLEFLIVVFRIADHVRDIAAQGGLPHRTPFQPPATGTQGVNPRPE